MPTEIITTDDLREFKMELLDAFKKILKEENKPRTKKWLKSREVCKLLGVSSGTLQTLRAKGTIPYAKVGGVMFYDADNIRKMLEQSQVKPNYRRRGL